MNDCRPGHNSAANKTHGKRGLPPRIVRADRFSSLTVPGSHVIVSFLKFGTQKGHPSTPQQIPHTTTLVYTFRGGYTFAFYVGHHISLKVGHLYSGSSGNDSKPTPRRWSPEDNSFVNCILFFPRASDSVHVHHIIYFVLEDREALIANSLIADGLQRM